MREVFNEATPQKENATDAAAERETVITWSDADQVVTVTTSQQRQITQLKKNTAAVLLESDGVNFRYELPLGMITIRKGKKIASSKKAPSTAMKNAAKCGATKADGTICQMVAKKETGKCRWHS
jgi:hypothetical protein